MMPDILYCNFCGKSRYEVAKLIADQPSLSATNALICASKSATHLLTRQKPPSKRCETRSLAYNRVLVRSQSLYQN